MKNTKIVDGDTTVGQVIADLPLYEQMLNRGQLLGKDQARALIEALRVVVAVVVIADEDDEESRLDDALLQMRDDQERSAYFDSQSDGA